MNNAKAEIITIGDEILYGQILDTNSQWMCTQLDSIGVRVVHRVTIGDNREDILEALKDGWNRSDIILVTGGLGPTEDDITKDCLAEFFETDLVINEEALEKITAFFHERGRELTEINRKQAEVPVGAEMLDNKMGTAPGLLFQEGSKILVAMAGVPVEMKYLLERWILPRIAREFELPVIYHKMIKTVGVGESFLADKIKPWSDKLPKNTSLAFLPSLGIVKLRLSMVGSNKEQLKLQAEGLVKELMPIAGKYIFGYDHETLEEKVGEILREKKLSLSAAESCTGGYFSHQITSVAGSSDYFKGAIISYDNVVKKNSLNVPQMLLDQFGAVSEEVVKEMAINVRKELGTDVGISVSGIAGPGGGSEEKPVGTVWICYADEKNCIAKKLSLGFRSRETNIHLSALAMLNLLRRQLTNH